MIDCLILAGGLGTRLQPFVPDTPKPLAPINGVPFLDLLLDHLPPLNKIVLAIGYKSEQIVSHYTGRPIAFSIEETPLGTGGAIQHALPQITTPHFLILNGDSFLDFSLEEMLHSHLANDADLTLAAVQVENANRYGRFTLDSNNRILNFSEKSPIETPGTINGGVYIAKRSLFASLPFAPPFSLEKEVFPLLLKKRMFGHPCSGTFIDIGTGPSFQEAQHILKR